MEVTAVARAAAVIARVMKAVVTAVEAAAAAVQVEAVVVAQRVSLSKNTVSNFNYSYSKLERDICY